MPPSSSSSSSSFFCFGCVWLFLFGFCFVGGIQGLLHNESSYVFPVNSSTFVASAVFGHVPMTTWNAKIEFGEDLYFGNDHYCSGINYEKRKPVCIPCNYSGPAGPEGCLGDDLNARNLDQLSEEEKNTLPDCECTRSFCYGETIKAGEEPTKISFSRYSARAALRYEHTDWEKGFVVHVDPIAEGPVDVIITTKLDGLSAHDMISHIYIIDSSPHVMACPSHPNFGPTAETITYFLIFLPGGGSDYAEMNISIDVLPALENEQPAVQSSDLLQKEEGVFPYALGEIGDPPLLMKGLDMLNAYGNSTATYYWTNGLFYKIDRCRMVSVHFEVLEADYEFDYFGQWFGTVKLWTEEYWELAKIEKFRPYKYEEHILSAVKGGGYVPIGSMGNTYSVCPWKGQPTYLQIGASASVNFPNWKILAITNDVTESPHFVKQKIGTLSPYGMQSAFKDSLYLSCPCRECDNCDSPGTDLFLQPWWNRRTKISRSEIRDFFDLSEPGCDLATAIGDVFRIEEEKEIIFRCAELGLDTACGMLRVVPVTDQFFPKFYPYPEILRLHDPLYSPFNADMTDSGAVLNTSLGFLIVTTIDNRVLLDTERLDSCSLKIPPISTLFTEHYLHPQTQNGSIGENFERKQPVCDSSDFIQVSKQIRKFGNTLFELVFDAVAGNPVNFDKFTPQGLLYGAYALTLTEEWQGCQELMASLLENTIDDFVVTNTKQCKFFDPADPCCNRSLGWDVCCEERDIVFEDIVLPSDTLSDVISDQCKISDCVETFVEDYQKLEIQIKVSDLCTDPGVFIDPTKINELVSTCKKMWIGDDDLRGFRCRSHSDCNRVPNQECNFHDGVCQGGREDLELGFLTCLLDNLGSVERTAILSEIRRSGFFNNNSEYFDEEEGEMGKILSPELLRDFLFIGEQCVSDRGPMSPRRVHYAADSLVPLETTLCKICFDVWCLTAWGCDLPLQCLDYRSSCTPTLVLEHNLDCNEPTPADHVCNWDPTLTEEECGSDYRCMFCHNSSLCIPLPAETKEECESPICIFGDGNVAFMSEEECLNIYHCSELCPGRECTSQEECETIGGKCGDNDEIQITIELAAERSPSLRDPGGVCIKDIFPFNFPSCPFVNEGNLNHVPFSANGREGTNYDFTTTRGCALFSNCSLHNFWYGTGPGYFVPDNCVPSFHNKSHCAEGGGTWLELPISSKDVCLGKRKCNEPGQEYFSDKNEEECDACEGVTENIGEWFPGRWLSAAPSVGQWRQSKMTPTFHYVSNSISFVQLNNLLTSAINIADSLTSLADFSCRISPFLPPLRLVACSCEGGDGEENDEEGRQLCIEAGERVQEELAIGDILFCPGVRSEVGMSVGQLIVEGEWIKGEFCRLYRIQLADIASFVGNHERKPLTTLADPNVINQYPVRNTKGASIGRVVASGLSFEESLGFPSPEELLRVKLRLFLDPNSLKDVPSHYVFDFGVEVLSKSDKFFTEQIELRPLGVEVRVMGAGEGEEEGEKKNRRRVGEVMELERRGGSGEGVVVVGEWEMPLVYGPAQVYVVAREEKWEDEDAEDILTEGERILLYIFCGLYGASFLAAFFLFMSSFCFARTSVLLFIFVELTFLFRAVYLGLFASGYLQEEQRGSFLLVEPPSFFILSISSIILLSFSFVLYFTQHPSPTDRIIKRFWVFFATAQIVLYSLLVAVLVTLSTIDHEDVVTVTCFGRSADVDASFSVQAIRIAYHALLFLFGLVFSCAILSIESAIHKLLRIRSLLVLSALAVISVLLTNLLWVVYSSMSGSSPYFVIPLWCTEAIPSLAICVWVRPKEGITAPNRMFNYSESSVDDPKKLGHPSDSTSLFM